MFKFPYGMLVRESEIPVDYAAFIQWLEEQGFEIASLKDTDDGDKLIEIEVKANRPDMLSVAGVLREYYISQCRPAPKVFAAKAGLEFTPDAPLSRPVVIKSKDVHRYYAVELTGIDNKGATPGYVTDALGKLGIALINPVVDLSNYLMILIGQPTHVFDADKVQGAIVVQNVKTETKFVTLSGSEITLPAGAVLISDDKKPLCVAGIIGSKACEVTRDTTHIIIESANFDHVIERVVSKKSHVQTLASYRYERGVNKETARTGAGLLTDLITSVCGGRAARKAFVHDDGRSDVRTLPLSVKRVNALLGATLTQAEIAGYLNRCYFTAVPRSKDVLAVTVPAFRLDVQKDVDLIEEVGRIYGYHNIVPQAVNLNAPYKPNPVHIKTKQIRELMVGFGGIECLTYGFIPENAMQVLRLDPSVPRFYGDIKILNPLSAPYALMRPTLAYGLIDTAADNIKRGVTGIHIFEPGKTFFRDPGHEDGYNERNTLGAVLYGVSVPKGYGIVRDNNYSIYDAHALVKGVLDAFNVSYVIQKTDAVGMFKQGSGGYILVGGTMIGVLGIVDTAVLTALGVENIAVADMLYIELDYTSLEETKRHIEQERLFPGVTREYNLIVKNGTYFADYRKEIERAPGVIQTAAVDVYTGKGIEKGYASVLVRVEYSFPDRAVALDEVVAAERQFLAALGSKYGIALKA